MFLKRDKKDDCIISGPVVVDMKEKEFNGKVFNEFGMGMGKDEKGNNLPIVNVTLWDRTMDIKKGDRVAVFGKLKVTQKDDKTYYTLTADCVIKEISEKRQTTPPELTETEDDDLPF